MKYNIYLSYFLIFFVILSSIVVLYKYSIFMKEHNTKIIESFQDELYIDLSEDDKKLYFSIIDTYQLVLQRDPSEEELNIYFTKLKTGKMNLPDLFNKLKQSTEYKQINDVQENTNFTSTTVNNDIQDYQLVLNELQKLMPQNKEYDPVYIDFLIMKYRDNDKNIDKFKKYIISTPEYSDYIEEYLKNSTPPKETKKPKKEGNSDRKTNTNTNEEYVLLKDSANVEYKISPPNINTSSVKTEKKKTNKTNELLNKLLSENSNKESNLKTDTCEFYNEFEKLSNNTLLADLVNKRNLEQLKYSCSMAKDYENVDSNMKLLPHQKWTVPQKRAPVCHSQLCTLNDTYSQTALIGTLITDVHNEKILPSFKYEETNN
jgi:hypothetical protein